MNDIDFMKEAFKEAVLAYHKNEVPIGSIIIYDNKIIGRGHNLRMSKKNSLYHGEIIAINEACEYMGDWRLEDCTIYVTVEPCPMCSGAILQSRIKKVVFGTFNSKAGCCGSVLNMMNNDNFNHKVEIVSGVMEEECRHIMQDFFKKFRNK